MATLEESSNEDLKYSILQLLSCGLHPESDIQRLPEERIKALELTEDYPFILMEIIANNEESFAKRLMAATYIKNFINDMNNPSTMIQISDENKGKIVVNLIELLGYENENKAIAEMVSYALEILFISNFGTLSPLIRNKIMTLLLSENILEIRGAILFMNGLKENHSSLIDEIGYFTPEYIEPLINILQNEGHSIDLRNSTISCLVQIMLSHIKAQDVFSTTSTRLADVFNNILIKPYSEKNNFYLKKEIIFQLNYVISKTNAAVDLVTACLPAIGRLMNDCCVECEKILKDNKQVPCDIEEVCVGPRNFQSLLQNILILIFDILLIESYRSLIINSLDEFFYLLFILMAYYETDEQATLFEEEILQDNPEADDTVRKRCVQVFVLFIDICDLDLFNSTLHNIIQKHTSVMNIQQNNLSLYEQKILESLMYGVGLFTYVFKEPNVQFAPYIQQWSQVLLENCNNWILLARLIWLGGRYSAVLDESTLDQNLRAIFSNYTSPNQVLKMACIDSLKHHLANYGKMTNQHKLLYTDFNNQIINCLLSQIEPENIKSVLLHLQAIGSLFELTTVMCEERVAAFEALIWQYLTRYIADQNVVKEVKLIFSKILSNNCINVYLQDVVYNDIFQMIYESSLPPLEIRVDMPERAFDILNTVILYSPEDIITDGIIIRTFFATYQCLMQFNDGGALEICTGLMSNLLMKAPMKMQTLVDNNGKLLCEFIPPMLCKLLQPYPKDMMCPSKLGRLVVISVMTLPEKMDPHLEDILRAIFYALQRVKKPIEEKSFCFIIAYMFTWQAENITTFLSTIPGPEGGSALKYFMRKWSFDMINYNLRFERNIMIIALTNMIDMSISNQDVRIDGCYYCEGKERYSGLEKLFLYLIRIFLDSNETDEVLEFDEFSIDLLVKNHPICALNMFEHVEAFLKKYINSPYYISTFKRFIAAFPNTLEVLEKYGVKPIL